MYVHIFGYGSLLNPQSRAKTFKENSVIEDVVLVGYQRILNAATATDAYIAMNIFENNNSSVSGVLTAIPKHELPELMKREYGYEMVEVTDAVSVDTNGPVYTFIMKDMACEGKVISKAYLETCLGGVCESKRDQWMRDTVIDYEIVDDRHEPMCQNYIPLK